MCKIMIIPGIPEQNQEKAWEFAKAAAPYLTEQDPHGFGYAAYSTKTGLFGERWLNVESAFTSPTSEVVEAAIQNALGETVKTTVYNSFGTPHKEASTIMLHGRFATNEVTIENTHPFVRNQSVLIHNGVISNYKQLENITSTNDSETILNEYVNKEVLEDPEMIQALAWRLSGWYAVGVLSINKDGVPLVDVFKEDKSTLYIAWIEELGTTVYCTSQYILEVAARACGFTISGLRLVPHGRLIRLHAVTRERLHVENFDVKPMFYRSDWWEPQTGKSIEDADLADELKDITEELDRPFEDDDLTALYYRRMGWDKD